MTGQRTRSNGRNTRRSTTPANGAAVVAPNSDAGVAEFDWFEANQEQLRLSYGGLWIAISGDSVVASADELSSMFQQLDERPEFADPLVVFVHPTARRSKRIA